MPLDPYFEAQLAKRRTQLIGQFREGAVAAIRSLPARLRARVSPRRRATEAAPSASPAIPAPSPAPSAAAPSAATATPIAAAAGSGASPAPARGTRSWEVRNARRWDTTLHGRVGIDGPSDLETREFLVPVTGFPDVRVRLYLPPGPGPHPAVIAFFGGAFHLGGIDWTSIDAAFRRRTAEARVATLAVDYALAPEERFPTPVEQGHAALEWLFANAAEQGIDAGRVGINGTSSGGSIAAAVTLLNRARSGHPLRLQLLEVPTLDLTGAHVDFRPMRAMGIPRPFARAELSRIARRYLGDRGLARGELASPLRARDLSGLPPAHILTAEYDALRGDGAAYADRLRRAGVEATAVQYQGANHEAAMFTAEVPLARRWHAEVVRILGLLHEPAAPAVSQPTARG